MNEARHGLSIVELLVVVAVAAVLLGVGIVQFNFGGQATSQAAQVVASAVNRARFEAVRTGTTSGFEIAVVPGGSGRITVCRGVDESVALSCATGTVSETIELGVGDLARAVVASPASLGVYFDRRGVVRNPASSGNVVTITDRGGGNGRTVTILATGRAEVN